LTLALKVVKACIMLVKDSTKLAAEHAKKMSDLAMK